jgi:peptide/nickel transport system ATP-binding protein/oligopeptide transport system ATP-binding protein
MTLSLSGISHSYAAVFHKAPLVLDNVSLTVGVGQSVGLVGESGSGKSTLVKCALGLVRPRAGRVAYDGMVVGAARGDDLKRFRRNVQLVFQDPYASLNPRMNVAELVGEGLIVHRLLPTATARRARVVETLEMVGLGTADMTRAPREFSGGQRQRIAIARALAIRPRILVCDEPVSALDVSVQAQVINLLRDMQRHLGLGILFVSHDLAVVRHLCDTITVLHLGQVVEQGFRDAVFGAPSHPYTRALLDAVPTPDPKIGQQRRAARRLAPAQGD